MKRECDIAVISERKKRMKVFHVIFERDGKTEKEPGKSSTEVIKDGYYYAAEKIEEVWNAIDWMRRDPERTLMAIVEVLPSVTVILGPETKNVDHRNF